jgi:metallo-beta-lactamase family protein
MRLSFHGAARNVTGSRHLLEVNGKRILLDCGLFQGRREESNRRNREFGFDPKSVDAVVLSHAHIDHSGALPSLVKHGFRGPIHATRPTVDLAKVMLEDSAFIQERDVEYVSKREGREIEPLYTVEDAKQTARQMRGAEYWQSVEVADGVRVTFHEAGHMLGSSVVRMELSEKGRKRTVFFSGDFGRAVIPVLRSPELLDGADAILVESTYGNRRHQPEEDLEKEFGELVRRVVDRKGKLLVPAFAVGRTQHLTYVLNNLSESKRLPEIPVFVDSPLAAETTEIFRKHPECYDEQARRAMEREPDGDPLMFRRLHYTRTPEESKRLNDFDGPAVIIAASGMCEHGRILHHLYHHGQNERNCILFVGYQAEGTLGRRILNGERHVKIYGRDTDLRAEVVKMDGFSAHADRGGLEEFVRATSRTLRDVFVVHGEPDQADAFASWVSSNTGARTLVPGQGQEVTL